MLRRSDVTRVYVEHKAVDTPIHSLLASTNFTFNIHISGDNKEGNMKKKF